MFNFTFSLLKKVRHPEILLTFLLVTFTSVAFAQTTTVTGHIIGTDGVGIPGVSVQEQNSTNGTATNSSGDFTLNISNPNATLLITSLGYASQTISLNGRTDITVTLLGSVTQLAQVVVIGYGTQQKKDLTGASATVKGAQIANIPVLTATQAIQGKVAGVRITSSGAPGSAPAINARTWRTYAALT